MRFSFNKAVYFIWGLFFTYWFLSSLFNKSKTEQQESIPSRLSYLFIIGLSISLIVFDPVIFGPLLWRFLPEGIIVYLLGLVLLVSGLGFAVWARIHLGRYWSARVSLAKNHQLIQTGPYHLVRNPIYFGGLLAVFGTALVVGEIRAIVAIVLMLVAFLYKIYQEEKWLKERFGLQYIEYQKTVKSLIPFVY